jgi:putative drug exporter of the RND superfamily
MGNGLHRLGEKMYQLKWWVVSGWVALIGLLGVAAFTFMEPPTSNISIPGTEAQKTLDRFQEVFPETGSSSATVVIAAPEGKTIDNYSAEVAQLTSDLAAINDVTNAISPVQNPTALSEDKTIAYITVQLRDTEGTVNPDTIAAIETEAADASTNGLTVVTGGSLSNNQVGEILGIGEIVGVGVALLVLVITLSSLVAAGLPIITALITIGVSMAGLFALSGLIELTSTAPVLAVMLGLAVGIDYSLFIINRYRTFVKEGYDLQEAAGKAIATAGNAVLFAASTVVVALASLAVVQIPFMTVMGLAAAATVALAAIVAITLMPAFFGIFGLKLFRRKERAQILKLEQAHKIQAQRLSHNTIWYRIGEKLLRYRKSILASALILVILLAIPAAHLRLGLPTDETAAEGSSGRTAYELLAKGFGPGYNGPLLLVVEGLPETTETDLIATRQQLITQFQAQMAAQPQSAPTTPAQLQAATAQLEAQVPLYLPTVKLQAITDRISDVEGVASVQAALLADNGTKAMIQVTPTTGPSDEATNELVAYLRDNQSSLLETEGASFGVTGTTAIQIDINDKLANALPIYLSVVVGLSFILLLIAFRSILIPIKATLGFLLSVFAMFGALVAVFQWGWLGIAEAPGPIVSFIPIIAIGILFGLAMDYEFFLVSGMQEAYHEHKHAKKAVLRGFALGSRVVVAAAVIMVAVFAGFITNHDATIQSIGFALALGIFVDAFIVRMIIVPIVMSYLGTSAWWVPRWLDRWLPHISIEGEARK